VTIPVLTAIAGDNQPPNPPIITGPSSGIVGELYEYSILITDPDDDYMRFLEIDFGDGDIIEKNSGYERLWRNGTVLSISHRWETSDSFGIRARVQDLCGEWSDWSDPLSISISKSYIIRFISFLESHPNIFPLIQQLIKLLN
jgi:hypothetical protein